jgi:hypothetical protein
MGLTEQEKRFLEPTIIDYLIARSKHTGEFEASDALYSQIKSIRPDMSEEAINTAIGKSEPLATTVVAGEMVDLRFHIGDMLEKLGIWLCGVWGRATVTNRNGSRRHRK